MVATSPAPNPPNTARLLIADDDALVRRSLARYFRSRGFETEEVEDGVECVERFEENPPALLILDLMMPRMGGLDALREIRRKGHLTPVVVLTALQDIDSAVEATRLGANEYLTKPFDAKAVVDAVERSLAARASVQPTGDAELPGYAGLIGRSARMRAVFERLRALEGVDAPTVLITGESGTGKDLVARAVHSRGPRSPHPFVEVDCTSIPENLMESTLFGHERGSFTGASRQHQGLFEVARGGVVFLDEIGEMAAPAQAKLLRALENRKFKRVGGTRDIEFDAAVVAATNRELHQEVAAGRFREDLFYRLAVIPVELPSLRERSDDVPLLVEHFIRRFNDTFQRTVQRVAADALESLVGYSWPGNVRELRNVVERMVIFTQDDVLTMDAIPPEIRFHRTKARGQDHKYKLPPDGIDFEDVERSFVEQALDMSDGNQSAAARMLHMSRYAFRNRMKKFGLL